MPVTHRHMSVRMIVGFLSIPWEAAIMWVVCVMNMCVLVAFGEVRPDADAHQDRGQPE